MLRAPCLILPESFPHPDAISSIRDNLHSYEPEFWELEYQRFRYLKKVPDGLLIERYKDILRNMRALISRERNVIPIKSFLSSWYWFRKEHQTRLEFTLREVPIPLAPPFGIRFNNDAFGAPIQPTHPNAGDVLFRYDKRTYIEDIAYKGKIRIRAASDFQQMENDRARQDDECTKKSILAGVRTRITSQDGQDIPFIGCVEISVLCLTITFSAWHATGIGSFLMILTMLTRA